MSEHHMNTSTFNRQLKELLEQSPEERGNHDWTGITLPKVETKTSGLSIAVNGRYRVHYYRGGKLRGMSIDTYELHPAMLYRDRVYAMLREGGARIAGEISPTELRAMKHPELDAGIYRIPRYRVQLGGEVILSTDDIEEAREARDAYLKNKYPQHYK